ncbi:hypothetical protein PSU4_36630 [Pseudonocardia sulfidoxydans NBRC 16205]|uniref:Diaminobutyrate--2-oxoglutarate transaminase n=1 Tax=Pseudonocardia sulfidoxydans NBRC 16205 TaxID=1223511 RepID=A0A511DIS3_9PSEU|nr:Pls/PosA family non-ribosomal peptide synthetase [Pseudonocardia sulfidoxydans]GEL24709.1 hypothetical protein PSU4_36630 [Pseudonocardia sulfidoxydans NBRC 16205]
MTTLQEPDAPPTAASDAPALLVAADYAQGSRARTGERLDHVFEEQADWMRAYGRAGHLAVDTGDVALTYSELDERANRLARQLLASGARAGDRIALLFDQAVHSYVGMLAVMKINAAYVPLDVAFPADRIAYILSDAGVSTVLSLSHVPERVVGLEDFAPGLIYVDRLAAQIEAQSGARLTEAERGTTVEDLAYLIYTSGTTGRPKGVAIEHASICNFVRVAAEVYGLRASDRVYQGMTIAFDFSVEEIWVPWMAGATLVPKPAGMSLLGMDLHAFLTERRVTAMCVVPTLLATIEEDLPALRFLLVSGEACPQDLVARWHRDGRRFLNVYGPTEATVTATWTEVHPDRPVTIGQPLPTYTTVVLDPDNPYRALPHGEVGEIGIAGIGLATGYLNREDLTDKSFIEDFLGIAGNPSGRIYRTGDLGRVNDQGEIEYMGRIDLQVKIRGYRIELTEIESVLLQVPGVSAAVVDTFEPTPGQVELVGYYSLKTGVAPLDTDAAHAHLRERLPAYMVPAYLEHLAAIPMTTSDKADRKALPPPTMRRAGGPAGEMVAAETATEEILAATLARTIGLDTVSVDSNFFDDLGANSLLMARFSAALRKETSLAAPSMREIYAHPTIRELAIHLGGEAPGASAAVRTGPLVRTSTIGYLTTGLLQLLAFLGVTYGGIFLLENGFIWATEAPDITQIVERTVLYGVGVYLAACLLPIALKWLLVGRWKQREIRLWGPAYLRFWLVRTLVRVNPLVLFAGSPLYTLYLRALGAKIGRGATVLSRTVPVATDLITIGEGAIVRRDSSFTGYHAVAGAIRTGHVTIGRDAFVGEATVLDIGTAIGDGGQLGHSSSLHTGQAIPAGERWHGVPAEPTTTDYRTVQTGRPATLRRVVYSALQLLVVLVVGPAALTGVVLLASSVPAVTTALTTYSLTDPAFYLVVALLSLAVYVMALLLAVLVMVTVPRLLRRVVRPGRTYPLYGVHWAVQRTLTRLTNSRFLMLLLGDSSFIVGFVQALGYDLRRVDQTGSNFGTEMHHDTPYLTTIGSGTMVSDGLSVMNADFSTTSFRVSPVTVGDNNFLGNNIAFPTGAAVGANVLLATKVMVPIDGPVRENVGLLGSPPFEIPRGDAQDVPHPAITDLALRRRVLVRKNLHNASSMLVVLLLRWVAFTATILFAAAGLRLFATYGTAALATSVVASLLFTTLYGALLERATLGFRRLRPRVCSIYDRYFWHHERLWKLYVTPRFTGTPFGSLVWRLAGVRMGRRVFDDGAAMPEKSLVTIGSDVVLNAGSVIQCHSLENGSFKSGATVVGDGATLGVKAFVHYDVTIGDGAILEADAFLMKGEVVEPHAVWRGNPATELRERRTPAPPAAAPTAAVPAAVVPVVVTRSDADKAAMLAAYAAGSVPNLDLDRPAPGPVFTGPARHVAAVEATVVLPTRRIPVGALPAGAPPPAPQHRPAPRHRPAPQHRPTPPAPAARPVTAAVPRDNQESVMTSTTTGTARPPAAVPAVPAPTAPAPAAPVTQPGFVSGPATGPRPVPRGAPAPRPPVQPVRAAAPMTGPSVTTPLPGPRSAELLARQARRESNARVYPRHFPFAVAEAQGSFIRDLDGNVFVDFLAGAGVLSLGHNHPELVAAATEQMGVFTHGLDMASPAKDAFTDAQLSMLPVAMRDRMRIQFCGPTGANAVDAAIKLCKTATGRGQVVSFQGGFHGSSHAAMALTGNVSQKRPVANGMPGVQFFPFSSCSRCPLALDPQTCQTNCVSFLERALNDPNGGLELPAAVIMELVQGEGGVIPARLEFVQRVRRLTRELGIPLIVDEVQTGCGRTGTWFAFEQYDIEPDVVVASKALSGMGQPVAIIMYDEKLDTWAPGAHTGTFRGNQLAFAAGARTVEIVRRDGVLGNVVERGRQVAARLGGFTAHPAVLEVRGMGLMWGIELVAPADGRTVTELAEDVQARALRAGLIVELGGRDDCVVRMLPPLNVTAEVMDVALAILVRSIEAAWANA